MTTPPLVAAEAATGTGGMNRAERNAFAVFSIWIVTGLFLDGWSHNVRKPESFFTPWHGLMYSGFGAAVAWSAWYGRRATKRGTTTGEGLDKLVNLGALLFGIGMLGDLVWHTLLGIEVNVEALLSPTHLTLMTGGLLLAGAPARAARRVARDRGQARPDATYAVVVSVAAVTAVVAFFTQFASAFRGHEIPYWVFLHGMGPRAEWNAIRGVTAILITNVVLVGAAAFLAANWRTRLGSLTFLLGIVAVGLSGLTGFQHGELVLAAVLGGLAGDVAVERGHPDLVPVVIPLAMWPAWTAILALTTPFGWSPNVWGGSIFLCVLTGFGVRLLTGSASAPTPAPR